MITPIDNIKDGYKFQQLVAEYFRWLKNERLDYQISDVLVDDSGVGSDDGCDILVEFHFEDAIGRHKVRWIVECKCTANTLGNNAINTNALDAIIKAKNASGYLLISKANVSSSLKRIFNDYSKAQQVQFVIWTGSQLWSKFSKSEQFLKTFFPDYYKEKFIESKHKEQYDALFKQFQNQLDK